MMVRQTRKCTICGFQVTKNGEWASKETIEDHIQTEHPKEWVEARQKWREIQQQINELQRQQWKYILHDRID